MEYPIPVGGLSQLGSDQMSKVFFRYSQMTKFYSWFFFLGGLAQLGQEEMTKLVFRYSQLNTHLMVDEEDKPRHPFLKSPLDVFIIIIRQTKVCLK